MNVSTLNDLDLGLCPLKVHSQGLEKISPSGLKYGRREAAACLASRSNEKVSNAKLVYGENKKGFNWRAICRAVKNKTSCSYHFV